MARTMTMSQASALMNALEQELEDDEGALNFFRTHCRQKFITLLVTGRTKALKEAIPVLLAVPPENVAKPKHYKVWSYKGTRANPFDRMFVVNWKIIREVLESIDLVQYGLARR